MSKIISKLISRNLNCVELKLHNQDNLKKVRLSVNKIISSNINKKVLNFSMENENAQLSHLLSSNPEKKSLISNRRSSLRISKKQNNSKINKKSIF